MSWFTSIFKSILSVFTSGRAKAALDKVADYAVKALPIIDVASQIVAGLTPTGLDDLGLAAVRRKYPRLFDGSLKTGEELKLYALGAATELLQQRYPELTTSIARAAVQVAYTTKTA